MGTRSFGAVIAAGCLLAVGACGSGGSQRPDRTSAGPTPSIAAAAPGSVTAPANDEAAKPPSQILVEMAAALRTAHGYEMQGTITQGHQRLRLDLTTTSAKSLDLAFSIGDATAELIGLPSGSYIRANVTFWTAQAGAPAARLADRWIQVPSSNARAVTSSLGALAPETLSRCLLENHGTLTVAGRATIDGRAAILLKDEGNVPGSSPSLMAIAAIGAPYPLRYTTTGDERAGGRIDVCNNGKASDARGTISFSRFGRVAPIAPPKGAQPPVLGPTA